MYTFEHWSQLLQNMRSRQSLEYTSTHSQQDGKLHKIEVRLVPADATKMKPYFRREYYAPSN